MSLQEVLRDLFLVDQQVRGLQRRLDGASRHVRAQQIKVEQATRQHEELTQQLRHVKAEEANLENEAATIEDRIQKLRDQMNTAKTNKEYSTFLVEVNTMKAEKGKVEESALELMTKVEQLAAEAQTLAGKVEDQKKVKVLADNELEERRGEVGEQLEILRRKRQDAASRVPDAALSVFEKLADNNDGEAMATVMCDDPRRMEYTCGACYMSIPVERVNQLCTSDELIRCTSCSRILYLDDEARAAVGSG